MKCKFENFVNTILFLMFALVLALITFNNCGGCTQVNEKLKVQKQNVNAHDIINRDSLKNN